MKPKEPQRKTPRCCTMREEMMLALEEFVDDKNYEIVFDELCEALYFLNKSGVPGRKEDDDKTKYAALVMYYAKTNEALSLCQEKLAKAGLYDKQRRRRKTKTKEVEIQASFAAVMKNVQEKIAYCLESFR